MKLNLPSWRIPHTDPGTRLMLETPLGDILYFRILPDGTHGQPAFQSRIIYRHESWGVMTILVDSDFQELTFQFAMNRWGQLRLWLKNFSFAKFRSQL